ncbi:uncharacterized protein LOC113638191 isoform X2 [Tachysurus fulvidraco]|nr:uncharacterized protein LOC113638191 isoform X2 [Tachysurus fulvidraco]
MRSPVRMEMSTWTPPVIQSRLPYPPQTLSSRPFCPTQKMEYDLQQKSFDQQSVRLSNPHAFSEPMSRSANLQPNWTPQMWNSGFHNQLLYKSPASGSNPPSHIVHHASLKAGNLDCDPPVLNTTYQRNYKDLHSMQSIRCTCSNTNCVFKNSCCRYGLIPPWQHPLNRHHGVRATHQPAAQSQEASLNSQINQSALTTIMNQGQISAVGQHNETPSSVAHVPAASRVPVNSLQPSRFIINSCQKSQSQVQKPLRHPLPSREYDGYIELKQIKPPRKTPYLPNRHVNSAQVKQSRKQFVPILPKDRIQSQATNISGHHNTNFATFTAIPSSTHQQGLQSNTVSGMTANSQGITSISSSTSHTSSSTSGSGSAKYSHCILLKTLLQNDNSQNSSVVSQSAKSKGGSQQSTYDHTARFITTAENYSQDKARQGQKQKEPAKEPGISRGNAISHLAGPQPPRQNERTNWKKRNDQMESCIDPAVSEMLVNSQLGIVQVNEVVAVVPPNSQQACSHGYQNDVTTSTNFRPVLKTNSAKNVFEERKNMEKETNVPNAVFNLIEGLPQVPSLPSSLPRLGSISEMPTSDKDPTSSSQSCEITQCENDPLCTTQISNKLQDSVHAVDSTSKVSVEQSDVQQLESSSEDTVFDLSTVPVVEYTLQELKDLVNSLEVKPAERDKSMINVVKCIVDLFYNGDKKNLAHLAALKDIFKISSELCVKEMHSLVLQYILPKHIKMLENCPQTLTNETTIPFEGFKSSWLNVDGQPADVDNVFEEPISDSNPTWFKKISQSVSESVMIVVDSVAQTGTDNPEDVCVNVPKDIPKTTTDNIPEDQMRKPEHSSMILPTADCKKDKMIVEKGCVRRTPTKLSEMHRISKKQFTQQLHDEIDTVKDNMRACNEQSLASSSNECETNNSDVFEEADVSDNTDFTDDLPEIILLSSEEARKIFADCFERDKNREPPQICHRKERKDLVTQNQSVNVKPQDDFKFTCSHMIGLGDGSDNFCPSCWNETPVLNFDEDETLLTPMEEVLNTDNKRQSLTRQSGKPIKYPSVSVSPECGNMITSTQKSNGSDVMRDSNPDEQTQRSSPPTARDPHHGTAGTKNSNITMASSLIEAQSRNSPFDNVKSPKTDVVPDADDIRFSPDIVIKNIRTFKHPSDHRSTSRNGGQCSDDSKQSGNFPVRKTCADPLSLKTKVGTPAQMPRGSGTPKLKNALPHKQKRPIIMGKGHNGQHNQSKKLRLENYGSKSSNSNFHRERNLHSAPVYLTVSPSPNTEKYYTDEQSAMEKVYSQWKSTFIHPQKKSKKKHVEDHLKSKIQTLKIALKEKLLAI